MLGNGYGCWKFCRTDFSREAVGELYNAVTGPTPWAYCGRLTITSAREVLATATHGNVDFTVGGYYGFPVYCEDVAQARSAARELHAFMTGQPSEAYVRFITTEGQMAVYLALPDISPVPEEVFVNAVKAPKPGLFSLLVRSRRGEVPAQACAVAHVSTPRLPLTALEMLLTDADFRRHLDMAVLVATAIRAWNVDALRLLQQHVDPWDADLRQLTAFVVRMMDFAR